MSKAGRPKKGSAGLPDWFDIGKYRQGESYGAAEWFQQLAFRSFVHAKLSGESSCIKEWLTLLQSNPHITTERLESSIIEAEGEEAIVRDWYVESLINEISLPHPHSYYGVKPATNGDITTAYQIYSDNRRTFLIKQENAKHADIEAIAKLHAQGKEFFTDSPIYSSPCRKLVQVDLTLPDTVLKKSFAEFLKIQKKDIEKSASPFFKNQEFAFWYSSGALPYLDLQLWEAESGQSFRWSAFVDALIILTEEDVASEDSCRKTAKALAAKLMDKRTIHLLKFQAYKEISEGRKKSGTLFVR